MYLILFYLYYLLKLKIYHKQNFAEVQQEQEEIETLYETVTTNNLDSVGTVAQ
jgi:hypothetical protein